MIPVAKKPKPKNFDELVKKPGMEFLKKIPPPTNKQWKNHDYWTRGLNHMRKVYKGVCSYSALWISPATGTHTVDHFKPKSSYPRLAYEWSNYRYASQRFNNLKGTNTILDPFKLEPGWLVMHFPSLKVKPNPALPREDAETVGNTIKILKLDRDTMYKEVCLSYVMDYCQGNITFKHLCDRAPFIAYELKRQGLEEHILYMMKKRKTNITK